jgi:DNA-binding response OmpR family regulator
MTPKRRTRSISCWSTISRQAAELRGDAGGARREPDQGVLGARGAAILLKNEIAVILIDVCMPELDGFELAAMIREHPRFEKTAIIFVSAITDRSRPLRGYEMGAVDYVPVPVVPELLRAKVRVFADLYRKTRQLERFNAELERACGAHRGARAANAELEQRVEERTRERERAGAIVRDAEAGEPRPAHRAASRTTSTIC